MLSTTLLMFEQDSFGMPSHLSNIISAIIARQIKKLHSQTPYVPGRRTSEHTVSETHLNLGAVKNYICWSTPQTAAPPARNKRPFIILYGPQLSSGLRDGDVTLQSPHLFRQSNSPPLSLCFLPLCQRQEHYLKNIARQIDWKYLMARLWKELRWLDLKGTKCSAYLIFGFSQKKKGGGGGSAGVWWDVLGGHPRRQSARLRVADTFSGWPREGIHF